MFKFIKKNWVYLIVFLVSFILGGILQKPRETVITKEVKVPVEKIITKDKIVYQDKIVYKDSQGTLDYVQTLEDAIIVLSDAYIKVYEVAEIAMDDYGYIMYEEYVNVYEFAKDWPSLL